MNLILSKLNLKILCNNSPVHNIQKISYIKWCLVKNKIRKN